MGGEWAIKTLGDVVELKRGYDLPKHNRKAGKIPIISSSGVSDTHSEAKVTGPGVVTGRYGTIGEVFFSQDDFWPLNTTLYVRDFKGNDEKFVYYFLKTIEYQQYSDKAAVPGVNRNHLHMAEVCVPTSIDEQKSIAHILSTLDDKIELNRQMNATLEAMAQALFKSWFVDFDPVIDNALAAGNPIPEPLQGRAETRNALGDKRKPFPEAIQQQFPSRFVFSEEMGWLPEGWIIKDAQDIADISIGKTPPRKEAQWFSDEKINNFVWVSIRDMGSSGVYIGDSSEYLAPESIQKYNVKVVPKDSVILSFKLTLGRVAIAQTELTTNEAIAHFVDPKFGLTKEYVFSYLKNFDYGRLGSTSSIATAINSKLIKAMPFIVPNNGLPESFRGVTSNWFDQISSVSNQINTLTKLRDTLLPKLLSGQLCISDAEAMVEQAAVG